MTAHGDPNTDVTAVLNLPITENSSAVRGVIYNDSRGGYIDNVPGTFTRKNTDVGIHYAHYPADANGHARMASRMPVSASRPAARPSATPRSPDEPSTL